MVNADIIELHTEQNDAQAIYERVPKKRGRPPKISATQQPTSTEVDNDPPSQPVASSQPIPRYNLRRCKH